MKIPALGPSHGATSRPKSNGGLPGVCSAVSRRRYGSAWRVSARPAADAAAFCEPVGRTIAPAKRGAEAGTAAAGSVAVALVWEEPQPTIAVEAVRISSAVAKRDRLPGLGSEWTGMAADRSGCRGARRHIPALLAGTRGAATEIPS